MSTVSGYVLSDGLYGRQGGELVKLPVTRTPIVKPVTSVTSLGADVAAACDALTPCRWCDKVGGCDCLDWMEFMLLDTPTQAEDEPCEVCGGMVCDCITPTAQAATLARISADPHGDLSAFDDCEIPY